MDPLGKLISNFKRTISMSLITILSVSNLFFYLPIVKTEAALSATGPVDANNGFPLWYQDSNGLKLDLMEAADAFGISDPVDPGNPFSQQIGFNAEGFWWSAEADVIQNGIDALVVNAMEAAFAGEAAVDGEQSAFGRVRFKIDVPAVGTYTVRHPFGTETFVVDALEAGPEIRNAGIGGGEPDVGCFAQPGIFSCDPNDPLGSQDPRFNFSAAQNSNIGPFLKWDTFNVNPALQDPALKNPAPAYANRVYVGNPAIPHAVTGSPVSQNFFEIVGPGGITARTDVFTVTGRLFAPVIAEVTPVPTLTADNTPDYTFSSTEAGTITYGGDCTSATTSAVSGNNTITFNALANGLHNNCTITVTNAEGGASNVLAVSPFTVDVTAPVLAEVTPVPTPTADATPNYTFSSTEAGTITYGGDTSSVTTSAVVGSNTIILNPLVNGLHNNGTITVTDAAGNVSALLNISPFTVFDGVSPALTTVTPVPSPTTDTTPNFTFSSTEAGTISYGGDCSSATTAAIAGNNTITFNALALGLHNNCTVTVTDAAANASTPLTVNPFTISVAPVSITQLPITASLAFSNVTPAAGENLEVSFQVRNNSASTVNADFGIADIDHATNRWNSVTPQNHTLAPGEAKRITFNKEVRFVGTHTSWIAIKQSDGIWRNAVPVTNQLVKFVYNVHQPKLQINVFAFNPLPPKAGQLLTATVTIQNKEPKAITITEFGVANYNQTAGVWRTLNTNVPTFTLAPNEIKTMVFTRTIDIPGTYFSWPTYRIGSDWSPMFNSNGIFIFWRGIVGF